MIVAMIVMMVVVVVMVHVVVVMMVVVVGSIAVVVYQGRLISLAHWKLCRHHGPTPASSEREKWV